MAVSYSGLLFFISSILMHLTAAQPQQNYLKNFCISERGNFTDNSTYQASLDSLLTSFSNTTVNYGFYNSSVGKVNAIGLCKGDLTADACRSCIGTGADEIRRLCPSSIEAVIYFDVCTLRYSDRSIFGIWEVSPDLVWTNYANFTDAFNSTRPAVLQKLMTELKNEAASGGPLRKYAVGEAVAESETLYALVQCTPDLQARQCTDCIDKLNASVPSDVVGVRKGANILGPSCNFRYETYLFYKDAADAPSPSPSSFPSPSPSPPSDFPSPEPSSVTIGNGKNNATRTAVIIVIPVVGSMILIICVYICLRKRKPKEKVESVDEIMTIESLQFNFNSIRIATGNFSDANKLGQGGFGVVYKGTLPNGQDVAVKRLSRESGQGELEFKNEVLLVAKLQHRNLVRLLGFSLQGIERLLIYEFLPNASLDHFIFDAIKRSQLSWERRYKVIEGIARGLLYLHEDSRFRIIHRDLKASNILLDAEMNPKISDFGMARLFSVDQTQGETSRIVGTYGYMAPEYAMHGNFSIKSDVYSFGVLILEIMNGQKNSCFRKGENVEDLINYAWRSWREGTISNLIDPTVGSGLTNEIMRCIHIGLLCVQENAADRPTMASVVLMLSSFSLTIPVPSRPALFMDGGVEQEIPLSLEPNSVVPEPSDNTEGHISIDDDVHINELYPR